MPTSLRTTANVSAGSCCASGKIGFVSPRNLIERLHEEVDRELLPLLRTHACRLQCREGCSNCCVDEITVFEVEADRIRRRHTELLRSGRPHPEGACAFLDSHGSCRIYEDRPYVCRTQGLPLRWTGTDGRGSPIEMRDICPLNDLDDTPLETLAASDCWTIGPFEGRLAQMQANTTAGRIPRVHLRDLFG